MFRALEIWVICHSWPLKMEPFHRLCTTSYQSAFVTIALSFNILQIFNFEKYRDLENLG